MTKHINAAAAAPLCLLFISCLLGSPAAVFADADCQKNADACAAGTKKTLPFLEAAAAAEAKAKPAPAPAAAPKPGKAAPAPDKSTRTVVAPSTAPAAGTGAGGSSPAWLLFVGAVFAGLYFYLRENSRKGKRR